MIKKTLGCLLAGTVAGILLLLAVFALPTAPMLKNVRASSERMLGEQNGNNAFLQYIWEERESFTDAIIVQSAITDTEDRGLFERVMMVYRYDLSEDVWGPEEALRAICEGTAPDGMYLREYSRYWHGYLVYVKPLLLIFTWEQLLIFGAVMQVALLAAFVGIAAKKKKVGTGFAIAVGYVLMKPELMAASITMSICWLLTLCILLYMISRNERLLEKGSYPVLFLSAGMLTSYLDFLTYPVVTLGFPLCLFFLLNEEVSVKKSFARAVEFSVSWGIGYIGIWGMKWLVSDLVLRRGTIKDALWTIIGRTEAIGGRPRFNGASYAIGLNFEEYGGTAFFYIIMAVTVAGAFVLLCAACARTGVTDTLKRIAPFAVCALIPFAWITVAQNHSAIHSRYTFRILAIAFLAVCCVGICSGRRLLNRNGKKPKENA